MCGLGLVKVVVESSNSTNGDCGDILPLTLLPVVDHVCLTPRITNSAMLSGFERLSRSVILGFYTIPRGTNDNRHNGHVGVFVKSTPTWPL